MWVVLNKRLKVIHHLLIIPCEPVLCFEGGVCVSVLNCVASVLILQNLIKCQGKADQISVVFDYVEKFDPVALLNYTPTQI